MSSRSPKNQLARQQKRNLLKYQQHLEVMGAAFCKATDLKPEETCLRVAMTHDERGLPSGAKYWYEKNEVRTLDKMDLQEAGDMIDLLRAVLEVHEKPEEMKELVTSIKTLVDRYVK